jgi:hypothetical protein
MSRRAIAAFTVCIWFAANPASALDVSVGGVDVGADVDVGGNGVSVDVDVDGAGGADVGVSAGSGGASVDVDVDVDRGGGTGVGGPAGSGAAAGADVGGTQGPATAGPSTTGAVGTPSATGTGGPKTETPVSGSSGVKTVVKPAKQARSTPRTISLPPLLMPTRGERPALGTLGYPPRPVTALRARVGVLPALVRTCRTAIASSASRLGATKVEAVSAGRQRQMGELVHAPLYVRIQYARQGGPEIRQAKVSCRVNTAGQVVAVR